MTQGAPTSMGRGRGHSARPRASDLDKAVEVEGVLAERIKEHEALQESAQGYQSRLRQADYEVGEAKTFPSPSPRSWH